VLGCECDDANCSYGHEIFEGDYHSLVCLDI
jgi:hypothetical protein